MTANLLETRNLSVSFDTIDGKVEAVRNVSLAVKKGEILAIVGESGCGKSAFIKAVMNLLPRSAIIQGKILLEGENSIKTGKKHAGSLPVGYCSMILQDPMSALDPMISVGRQVMEAIQMRYPKWSRERKKKRAEELLTMVGVLDSKERFFAYPWQFSGGMRQRIVLATALASEPKLLLADEPTTALDVTVQAQILDLIKQMQKCFGMSVIFVTHDLGVVARIADRVAVMYAGKVVEIGTAEDVFYEPKHPYTWGLLEALPTFAVDGRLKPIPGMPPSLLHPVKGDAFAPRNAYALAIDYEEMPPMFQVTKTHYAATWLLDERAPKVSCPIKRRLHERQ